MVHLVPAEDICCVPQVRVVKPSELDEALRTGYFDPTLHGLSHSRRSQILDEYKRINTKLPDVHPAKDVWIS